MSNAASITAPAVPAHVQLIQMCAGAWVAAAVHAAAKIELADHLADGPRTATELAVRTGSHAPSLYRFLRTIASLGILTEAADERFSLTPLGEALKTGAPGAARSTLRSARWERDTRWVPRAPAPSTARGSSSTPSARSGSRSLTTAGPCTE